MRKLLSVILIIELQLGFFLQTPYSFAQEVGESTESAETQVDEDLDEQVGNQAPSEPSPETPEETPEASPSPTESDPVPQPSGDETIASALAESLSEFFGAIQTDSSAQIQTPLKTLPLKKANYRANESITVVVEGAVAREVKVELFNIDGGLVEANQQEITNDPAIIKVFPPEEFVAGRYRLKITDPNGNVSTQEFTWGVLAINTNKSIYLPNEVSQMDIAVLDETGAMVCDAKLTLLVTNPDGEATTLTTEAGQIKVNQVCKLKEFTLVPDYETTYQTTSAGKYDIKLTAETLNGTHTITDFFEVRNEVPFDVERETATRIFPPSPYPVELTIKATEDFEGTINEVVPYNFEISSLNGATNYDTVTYSSKYEKQEAVLEASIFNLSLPFNGDYKLNQGFGGQHYDPILWKKYTDFGVLGHDGLDFDLPSGTEVLAVDDGEVARAGDGDYGITVVLTHEWGKSYYGHLSEVKVEIGQKVKAGDIVGLSGMTGLASGPHLHFGVKANNNDPDNGYYGKVNPIPYLFPEKQPENLAMVEAVSDKTEEVLASEEGGVVEGEATESEQKEQTSEEISPKVKVLSWNVSLKEGDEIKIGYTFDAPDISPQFYLLGPLEFVDKDGNLAFQEARLWQIAADLVQPDGRVFYSDNVATDGVLKFQTNTFDFTFNGEIDSTLTTSGSLVAHTVSKAAITRDEVIVGQLKVDGRLDVFKGLTGYNAAADFTGDTSDNWSNAGTTGAQTCSGTTAADCTRAFDIVYERLSGRAMVVYADTTAQKLYYCYWDGTAWGPQSACTPTNGTNDISLTSNGRPTFVSLKAKGGTNELLMGVSIDVAGTHEVEVYRWDGDSWENALVATDTTNASTLGLENGSAFDVEWESNSGDGMVVWGSSAGAGATVYRLFTSGSWGSDQTGPASPGANGTMATMNLDADPASNRIAYTYTDDGNDSSPGIWKADGSTAGWTMGNEDGGLESTDVGTFYADIIWQKSGSVAVWFAQTGVGSVDTEYETATCNGSGCTFTSIDATVPTAGSDDGTFVRLASSPNSNDIMVLWSHIDGDLYAQHWDGSAWEAAASGSLEATLSPWTALNTHFNGMPASFLYVPYSPWSRNWKFWDGADTTNTPTTQLADENVAPTGFVPETGKFRLRFSVIELSGFGQTDARKKLQYTSGASCTPNTVEGDTDCTWVDVDDPVGSGQWRYVDCNSGDASICNDNQTLSATTLSGSPTAGWWVQDKDAAGGSAMDHNALQLRELEYSVEANNAAGSTTYYFRMYDVDQDKTVRREQDNDGANDCVSATCTYPSLTTAAPAGPTNDQLMRHGKWFSSGVEQPFTF